MLINMCCNPRDSNSCSRAEDHILEAITIIMNYRVTMPLNSQKLQVLWENYNQTLEKLKACQTVSTIYTSKLYHFFKISLNMEPVLVNLLLL